MIILCDQNQICKWNSDLFLIPLNNYVVCIYSCVNKYTSKLVFMHVNYNIIFILTRHINVIDLTVKQNILMEGKVDQL